MSTPTQRIFSEQAANLDQFWQMKAAGKTPFLPTSLEHVYIKLDFKPQFEHAATANDARGFLRSVTRAAMAAQRVAEQYGGALLEVQGSMLHVGLPRSLVPLAQNYVADLHWAFRAVFHVSTMRVEGWRMAVDAGNTMVVVGRGVHGDDSTVCLGPSANRPAKYIYQQLELPEPRRDLRQFHAGFCDPLNGRWQVVNLDGTGIHISKLKSIADEVRLGELTLDYSHARAGWTDVLLDAAPIAPATSPSSPSSDRPDTYFGWVLRVDLDGFCKRVDGCQGDSQKMQELAVEFYCLMEAAAEFTHRHKESLAQLPWAGDNFTAAAVFGAKDDYDRAIPRRLVELCLDFEKEMGEAALECGFGGWAHGVAGGVVHGNSGGNVFLAGVHVNGRRFLVGAGEGFGRSAQAFGDINPKAEEVVVFEKDWERLDPCYQSAFRPATTHRGEWSSLYRKAATEDLLRARLRHETVAAAATITFPHSQTRSVPIRPHFR